ncbi:LysR family transcriptional regulator [Roseivivax halodurans JCM 10272]|uniref:LysR family transcriptional regulator n=1 Tax=Roseivivax halodurans JCM 10272 TaxID=1449350 RepID=X7EMM2_9RHOB|nr:pca operon transcription factor PcaQ [Roseivivax halodurans]ETX16396.1 LysR family transcriptional regulator [Roseivivax halodurans JCM 10272]
MSLDPRLRLRHLSVFLSIARTGSVAQAATGLGVTQPAVSKSLRELEDILGAPLFDRTGRRVVLNPAGAAFQRLAGSSVAALEQAQDAVQQAGRTTRLSVGALPTAATRLLPDAALRFRELRPDCTLRVSTGPNWLLLSQLREGALDLVVGRMADPQRMDGLTFRQLYTEAIRAVVRSDHPLVAVRDATDLGPFPLLLPPSGAVIHQTVKSWLVSIGAGDHSGAFESVSAAFGLRACLRSDTIWFISEGVVADALEDGRLRALHLDAPMIAGPVGISLRDGTMPSPDLDALLDALTGSA